MAKPTTRRLKLTLAALAALPLSFAARNASATYSYTINGSDCKVMESATEGLAAVSGTTITASGTVDVICPMVKHTSGPGLFDEYITGINATVTAGAGGVACHWDIYSQQLYSNADSLQQSSTDFVSVGPNVHQQTLSMNGFSTDVFWDNGITSPYNYWYSSDIICTMHAGTTVNSFSVTENGSLQSNYRIYSASSCKPTQPNLSSYQFFDGESGGPSGFWEAKQARGFTINCPVPADAGRGVQLSVGPSISGDGSDQLQCTGDAGAHWTTIPQNPSQAEWPTTTVSFAFKSGAQNIQCRMITNGDNDGDGKVLSYRSFPLDPLPRGSWTATASIGGSTASAFDNNLSTRWTTTNQSQRPG